METAKNNISVIVPVYNGSRHIKYFYTRLREALTSTAYPFELIIVNDGSTDNTFEILTRIKQQDSCLKFINQPRNLGQYRAIDKGIAYAQGTIFLILDDDCEYALEYIPLLLEKINNGCDLALGWRQQRAIPAWRKLASQITNLIISAVIRRRVHDAGGVKVFGNRGADILRSYGSVLGSVKALRRLKISQIKMQYKACRQSRYNFKKLLLLFTQFITAQLTSKPKR
jgi:glycosyltransferase involved in cell wall biosynthesis